MSLLVSDPLCGCDVLTCQWSSMNYYAIAIKTSCNTIWISCFLGGLIIIMILYACLVSSFVITHPFSASLVTDIAFLSWMCSWLMSDYLAYWWAGDVLADESVSSIILLVVDLWSLFVAFQFDIPSALQMTCFHLAKRGCIRFLTAAQIRMVGDAYPVFTMAIPIISSTTTWPELLTTCATVFLNNHSRLQ